MELSGNLIKRIIEEIDDPEFYWDQNSELSDSQIELILSKEEGYYDVSDEMWENNMEYVIDLEFEAIKAACESLWNEFPIAIKNEFNDFDDFWDEHKNDLKDLFSEHVSVDINLTRLINVSSCYPVVRTNIEIDLYIKFEESSYEDCKEFLDVLQINPYVFAQTNGFNPGIFPNIISRKNPVISPEILGEMLQECSSGELVILGDYNMDLELYNKNFKAYNQKIWISPKSLIVIQNYNGKSSCEKETINPLIIDKKQMNFYWENDITNKYGFYATVGPTNKIYNSTIKIFNKKEHGKSDPNFKKRIQIQRVNSGGHKSRNDSSGNTGIPLKSVSRAHFGSRC